MRFNAAMSVNVIKALPGGSVAAVDEMGPGSDRSVDRRRNVGDDVGESGYLDVADHEGGAVVVLLDHQVGRMGPELANKRRSGAACESSGHDNDH
jgi:hypothetical protein